MKKFPDEFRAHVDRGGCPFAGSSSIEGVVAPSDQHVGDEHGDSRERESLEETHV